MKRLAAALLILSALTVSVPAYAANGKKPTKAPPAAKPVMIKQKLTVLDALAAELAAAKGRFDFHSKKQNSQLKVRVKLPLSASLGIADLSTAAAALIHIEFSRADAAGAVAAYENCTLAFQAPDAEEAATATSFNYRLHGIGRKAGSKFVKGSCQNGLPAVQAGDTITLYALVNGARVDFMKK